MSFYLGTGSSGKIMHITKDIHDSATMQGGILPDTVFHSDLPYITYNVYEAEEYVDYFLSGWYSTTSFKMPSACVADILSNDKAYFVVVGTSVLLSCDFYKAEIPFGSNIPVGVFIGTWYSSHGYAGSEQIYYDDYAPTTTSGYLYKKIQGSGKRDIKIVVLNVTSTGVYIPPVFTSTDILVKGSGISVKGIDLLNYKYISPAVVNSSDFVFSNTNSSFQLVNSVLGSSLDLVSNSSKTEIRIDNKIVFSSLYAKRAVYGNISYFSANYYSDPANSPAPVYKEPSKYGTRTYYKLSNELFQNGDSFLFQFGMPKDSSYYYSMPYFGSGLLTYAEGYLFSLFSGNTAAAVVTAWNVYGHGGLLCMTREIVYIGSPPMNSFPIDVSSTIIKFLS